MGKHWQGKVWYAYGTSMTSVELGKYVPVVAERSGLEVHNFGIPGGSITADGLGKGNIKKAVMTLEDGKAGADLITLELPPNEGKTVGNIYDTEGESFCAGLHQCLRFLQEHTKAQIVVIVMVGANFYPPEQFDEDKQMRLYEFAECIERVARINSVPVINAFCEGGFGYARVRNKEYQIDQIHLNELGGKNMGEFVWSKLKNIPLWQGE